VTQTELAFCRVFGVPLPDPQPPAAERFAALFGDPPPPAARPAAPDGRLGAPKLFRARPKSAVRAAFTIARGK